MRITLLFVLCVASLTASCGASDPTVPVAQTPDAAPARLELAAEAGRFFAGTVTALSVRGRDSRHRPVDVDKASISTSDPSVVSLASREVIRWQDWNGRQARGVNQVITMVGAGTAVLRVSMSGVSDSLILTVLPAPLFSSRLVIDSFTVIEYRAKCAWDCPYLVYAPLLKLREPTGILSVDLLSVQFDVPTQSTGTCSADQLRLGPGFAGHINWIDPYLWANDMIFVQLNGTPLPPGEASVRVSYRDLLGRDGVIEATAEIQRMVRDPVFPSSPFAGTG